MLVTLIISLLDIKEKEDKHETLSVTQKTTVKVFGSKLTSEELDGASKAIGFFAIDHAEEGAQRLVLLTEWNLSLTFCFSIDILKLSDTGRRILVYFLYEDQGNRFVL